jgi:GH25 family lysozyme M1 (1,4-beta-N-acetylmuramidase)
VSGNTSFFVDCSSFQGTVSWARVAAVCAGGAEKVTEGTGYVNPFWAASKAAMRPLAAHGFTPAAYMFLDASGAGAEQAVWFWKNAGDLTGFGIAVDLERAPDGSPSRQQAVDAVGELRRRYPRHPIGGYAPHWYTGGEDLSFFDWLWASEYVNGSGDPGLLYKSVPATWWAPYGGESPLLLQFTSSASVAGVGGAVDCSAFQGTAAQLAARLLPAPPKPPAPAPVPAPVQEAPVADPAALLQLRPGDAPVNIPGSEVATSDFRIVVTGDTGSVVIATAWFTDGSTAQVIPFPLHNGGATSVVFRRPWNGVASVQLKRADTKTALGASAYVRF